MMNLSDGDLEAWYKPEYSRVNAELYLFSLEEESDPKKDETKHAADDKDQDHKTEAEERPLFLIGKG